MGLKVICLLFVCLCSGCASNWDVGKGNIEIRKVD